MKDEFRPTHSNNYAEECPEALMLYNVTITKVIESNQQLTKTQINALLQDPNVKSIHIQK